MLRYGVFDDFKGWTTLLIWGDRSLIQLAELFRDMAERRCFSILLNDVPWTRGEIGCSVRLSVTEQTGSALEIERSGQAISVNCDLRSDDLLGFAEKVAVLAASDGAGHNYLDVMGDRPIQIMVSKGEYPAGWPAA